MHTLRAPSYRPALFRASSRPAMLTAFLLLRLVLGALLLALAFLSVTALAVPAFAAALAAQGMLLLPAWPAALLELAGAIVLIVGVPARASRQ